MARPHIMVWYRVELLDGSTKSGTVAIPGTDPDAACRATVGLIRGSISEHYQRPACFSSFSPRDVDDVSVQALGPA